MLEEDINVLDAFPADSTLPEGGAAIGYLGCEVNKDGVTEAGARQYKQCPGSSWFWPDAKAFSVWCTHAYVAQDPVALVCTLQCHRPKVIDAMLKSYINNFCSIIYRYKSAKFVTATEGGMGG